MPRQCLSTFEVIAAACSGRERCMKLRQACALPGINPPVALDGPLNILDSCRPFRCISIPVLPTQAQHPGRATFSSWPMGRLGQCHIKALLTALNADRAALEEAQNASLERR